MALDERKKRATAVYLAGGTVLGGLFLYLLWSLRILFMPIAIGALSAYICAPALDFLYRRGVNRELGIVLLFAAFSLVLAAAGLQVREILPDEKGKLELKTVIKYRLNAKYNHYMGLDSAGATGNFAHSLLGAEFDPLVNNLNNRLIFSEKERGLFEEYARGYKGEKPIDPKILGYYRKNLEDDIRCNRRPGTDEPAAEEKALAAEEKEEGGGMAHWIVLPFVFLFLLMDNGQIKRFFVGLVPNRYFEVALTVLDNVDSALGAYLRGTFLECMLVGLTFIVCLMLIGVQIKWAVIIGLISGLTTAIPFLGTAIGLITGAAYALLAEEVHSILPFMTPENLIVGIVATVAVAHLLDNAVFQPFVLGSAVNLHPIMVILGITSGSLLFGFSGMLFAIPAIVISRVIIETVFKKLKAYYLI